jgi:hypothetical protein
MKVRIEPELAARKPLLALVEAARPVVEQAIGAPAERVTTTWDFRPDDHGQPRLRLTLTDWSGEATVDFSPDEFKDQEAIRSRIRDLWGSLLDEAIDRKIKILETLTAEGEVRSGTVVGGA